MGFLAPLYIAGLLTITLPILFHLIRRNPRGRQAFSSLMFLQASPPRLTRRSRLSNILLLILRAAALMLLAFAFARPFVNAAADLTKDPLSGRRMALLLDVSASMRRGDLWTQAKSKIEETLKNVTPSDEVALYTFDTHVHGIMTFKEWNQGEPGGRMALLRARLAAAEPGWGGTNLGDALATVADVLSENLGAAKPEDQAGAAAAAKVDLKRREMVLISDLQQGSHAQTLQGHEWPKNVTLEVRAVALKASSNAGLQWVKQAEPGEALATRPAAGDKGGEKLRLRVNNEADSKQEQLLLTWGNAQGPLTGQGAEPLKVYVPAGKSQLVKIAWPGGESAGVDRLVLSGDSEPFDNTLYVVPPRTETVRVVFAGDDKPDDVNGIQYYLRSALGETPRRKVEFVAHRPGEEFSAEELRDVRLVVGEGDLTGASAAVLRSFAQGGGDVLWVLRKAEDWSAAARLLEIAPGAEATETGGARDFSLLSKVDLDHPLFVPFADARFGDFTKIHFWKHRRVNTPAGVQVVAAFDDGDPFLMEKAVGRGTLRVMTSGWQPTDSQLALSTKFVPLMEGLIARKDAVVVESQYTVGEPIGLPPSRMAATSAPSTGPAAARTTRETVQISRSIITTEGKSVDLSAEAKSFDGADRPGIYTLVMTGSDGHITRTPLAVNLAADESRTAPMGVEELERWGAKLVKTGTGAGGGLPAAQAEQERRLRSGELENRQKLWRWLIIGVLGLLAVETLLAGRLARRSLTNGAAT
jgi:hypothetical protein